MDDFRKGSREWGPKARKEEKRKCRNRLKRLDAKEPRALDPANVCDAGTCDACRESLVNVDD